MNILQYLRHCSLQKFGINLLMTFILFLNIRTWKTFSITSIIFIFIITNKDDLFKENARIKQVLMENGFKKALIVKSLRELLTIAACLIHSNKASHRHPRERDQITLISHNVQVLLICKVFLPSRSAYFL